MNLIKKLFFMFALIFVKESNCSMNGEEDSKLKKIRRSFLDIPIELQAYIGTFLDQKSFINFYNTHPSFKAAANSIKDQKTINLSGKKLTGKDCKILCKIPFSKFILSNCELKAQEVQIISLRQSIIELDLSNNEINEDAAKSLGNLSLLTVLHLAKSMIRVKQITILGNSYLSSLKSLYLEHNYIGDEGVKALVSANLNSLTSLYLSKNGITDEGVKALSTSNLILLTKLYLTDNYITNVGAKALSSGNLKSLLILYLVNNDIEVKGVEALILGNLNSLTKLFLSNKFIRYDLKHLKSLNPEISIIGVYGAGVLKD